MILNRSFFEKELIELQRFVEEYEKVSLNIYHELSMVSTNWQDAYANLFFDIVKEEKVKDQFFLASLKDIKDLHTYINEQYEVFGKTVSVHLKDKDALFAAFDDYIAILNRALACFLPLNMMTPTVKSQSLLQLKKKIINEKKKMITIKEKVKKQIEAIEKIEKAVKRRLATLEISKVQASDFSKLI